jgi:hypothetical protein
MAEWRDQPDDIAAARGSGSGRKVQLRCERNGLT